ncbi:hypothetical protein, secreted [gut metagenome]|uniref:Putative auto-transporter adhesin head GIN domain-containing protein n=1 Tax=gut metagenome TaxID=749906 RepID=J9G4U0_9ZZZZ
MKQLKFKQNHKPQRYGKAGRCLAALIGCCTSLLTLLPLASCDNRNIHQVVREMAAAPVDTAYMEKRTIETNPFSTIDVDCFADVTYHQVPVGEKHRVEIHSFPKVLDNIEVKVEEGELVVAVDRRYKMPDKAVAVIDIYSPFANRFMLDGGKCFRLGKVVMTSPIELFLDGNVGTILCDSLSAHEVSLELNGTGYYHLKGISTGRIKALIRGGGRIDLEGKCGSAQFSVAGNGSINAEKLQSDSAIEMTRIEKDNRRK